MKQEKDITKIVKNKGEMGMTRNELFDQIADRIVEDFMTEHIDRDKIDHDEFISDISDILDRQLAGYEITKGCIDVLQ